MYTSNKNTIIPGKIEVALVGIDHEVVAWINVPTDGSRMQYRHVVYDGHVYEFDTGLQHCGERYIDILTHVTARGEICALLVTEDMVTKRGRKRNEPSRIYNDDRRTIPSRAADTNHELRQRRKQNAARNT